jgi:hypothetical protein
MMRLMGRLIKRFTPVLALLAMVAGFVSVSAAPAAASTVSSVAQQSVGADLATATPKLKASFSYVCTSSGATLTVRVTNNTNSDRPFEVFVFEGQQAVLAASEVAPAHQVTVKVYNIAVTPLNGALAVQDVVNNLTIAKGAVTCP